MAKWQCDKLIGARLCAPFFCCAHELVNMQMVYLVYVLWKGEPLVFMLYVVGVIFVSLFLSYKRIMIWTDLAKKR